MFDRVRHPVLRLLRVPHDPAPPAGAPGSLRVFRAGRNYYRLRLVRWGLGQVGALLGIAVSLFFLNRFEKEFDYLRDDSPTERTSVRAAPTAPAPTDANVAPNDQEPQRRRAQAQAKGRRNRPEPMRRIAERSPRWIFPLLKLLEAGGVLLYLVQIPLTYALARFDYELRWYMVTDRSLRIRSGITTVLESTMSFANIQQVVVSQGPLQRLLGLADVHVQSAGGGGGADEHHGHGGSLHKGVFHGVDNANEIRDLILDRLRQFRETGLGDPDDIAHPVQVSSTPHRAAPGSADAVVAAQELLAEARALRQVAG